jgi:CheY-like chemotaxis protein
MTTAMLALPLPSPAASPLKRKRVLLVDASPATRDLRAEALKKLGVDVDCACDITEARSWWRADLYNLVLINMESELGNRDKFCEDVRGASPPQQLAFLVGKPAYLAHSPSLEGVVSAENDGDRALQNEARAALAGDSSADSALPWGILEASRRISAVRSASVARTQAIRNRPTPPRDLEARFSKRTEAESQALPELQKEEIQ